MLPAFLFLYINHSKHQAYMKNPTKIFFFFIAITYTIFYIIAAIVG